MMFTDEFNKKCMTKFHVKKTDRILKSYNFMPVKTLSVVFVNWI